MDECSGRSFWKLDFLTTPLMFITSCYDFSGRCFIGSHTSHVDLVLKQKDIPHFHGKPLDLICGAEEPKTIPVWSHPTWPQPLAILVFLGVATTCWLVSLGKTYPYPEGSTCILMEPSGLVTPEMSTAPSKQGEGRVWEGRKLPMAKAHAYSDIT